MSKDWIDWHRAYDDPDSSLSERRQVVSGMVRRFLDEAPPGPLRCLSLCAGEAPDLVDAAAGHARLADVNGVAVELHPDLAAAARSNLGAVGLAIEVRQADASHPAEYVDVLPVDLLLLVGIFGNISDEDVRRTVTAVPALCKLGGTVIWTRHRKPPDLTPQIRVWFDDAGTVSTGFVSRDDGLFGVGGERTTVTADANTLPATLFRFR
jgi:hypothetical protein